LSFFNFNQSITTPSADLLIGHEKPKFNHNKLLEDSAFQSFEKMQKAALKDGVNIRIVSGYRHFNDQLRIWNKKYRRYKKQNLSEKDIFHLISNYSAIPGTSRHHWGTEIDIIDANPTPKNGYLNPKNFSTGGIYNKLYQWMNIYGTDFGFYLVYTDEENRNGFKFEPWHYSYKPLSQSYLKHYSRLDLVECIKNDRIGGNGYLDKNCLLSYFHTHLLGINPNLLP
jgi:LAS superfamily LD-carboxypeptidase LdcB